MSILSISGDKKLDMTHIIIQKCYDFKKINGLIK